MKKIVICTGLFLSATLFNNAQSQVGVNVNVNIGSQPVWGPVGYDYVEYYYLPDIDVYYYVPRRQFVYLSGSRWIFAASLPVAYRSYDLYSGYKVVINEPRTYKYHNQHKVKYSSYKGHRGNQVIIRNSDEPKYYVVKGHPKHKGKPAAARGHKKNRR